MATYHCTVKVGGKGTGGAHSDYIAREGAYSSLRSDEVLEYKQAGNMPAWADHDPATFWKAADEHERANGAVYREIEVALPRELSPEQRRELVADFIQAELGERHAYQFAIHNPNAMLDGGEQPHAHIMFSERSRDGIERDPEQYFKRYNSKNPERGGCKKSNTAKSDVERKAELVALRERWADCTNKHLEKHQHAARVDHRSLKEQGAEHTPERHLGPVFARRVKPEQKLELREHRRAAGVQRKVKRELGEVIQDIKLELKQLSEYVKQRAADVGALVKDGVANAMEQFNAWQAEKQRQAAQQEKALKHQAELAKAEKTKELKPEKKIERGYERGM
jgi:hypothetical protein